MLYSYFQFVAYSINNCFFNLLKDYIFDYTFILLYFNTLLNLNIDYRNKLITIDWQFNLNAYKEGNVYNMFTGLNNKKKVRSHPIIFPLLSYIVFR
jgi:hypothetical protein